MSFDICSSLGKDHSLFFLLARSIFSWFNSSKTIQKWVGAGVKIWQEVTEANVVRERGTYSKPHIWNAQEGLLYFSDSPIHIPVVCSLEVSNQSSFFLTIMQPLLGWTICFYEMSYQTDKRLAANHKETPLPGEGGM